MNQDLDYLIEWAKKHQITEEEHSAQVRSFAYGNSHFENDRITKADIDKAMETLDKEVLPIPFVPKGQSYRDDDEKIRWKAATD